MLLRLQMLRLAVHDLMFVQTLDAPERTMLGIACRQLAHKAVKLASVTPPDALSALREEAVSLQKKLAMIPGPKPGETPPPPPLVLCAKELHLLRPPLPELLGERLLITGDATDFDTPTADAIRGVEVIGLYFSASW